MPVVKKSTRASKPKKQEPQQFLFNNIERVPIGSLKPHPRNPRQGDVDSVMASLKEHGQYKPLVVNGRAPLKDVIAAGHHTWLAARKLGWEEIGIVRVNVDEAKHLQIMLIDNKTSDAGTYDDAILAEVLAELAGVEMLDGTGYSVTEFQDLIDTVRTSSEGSSANLEEMLAAMPKTEFKTKSKREEYLEEEEQNEDRAAANTNRGAGKAAKSEDSDEIDDIEGNAEAELQAVLEVKVENVEFWKQCGVDSGDDFEIPSLREDMLMEEIPPGLRTWGGRDATPDDGKSWFLYNYSLGGIKELPFDRTVLAFNTHDAKFEGWWETPAWYTCRVIAKGCRHAIVPDFSFYYTQPRVMHLFNVYRSMWLGRFFQEAGMKVAPRLQFDYKDPNTLDIALRNIPVGCPVLATSQQNIEDEKVDGPKVTKLLKEALDAVKPKSLIYYSGPPGKRAMEATKWKGKVVYLENYVAVRREVAFGKKEGLAAKNSTGRAKILDKARKRLASTAQEPESDDE